MAITDDVLSAIFKKAGVPDDEAAQHIAALKGMGAQALSAIPGLSSLATVADNAPAVAGSPEAQSVVNTLDGNNPEGADLVPNPADPIAGLADDPNTAPAIPPEDEASTQQALAPQASPTDTLDWTKGALGDEAPAVEPDETQEAPATPGGKGKKGSGAATEGSNPMLQPGSSTEAADREKLHEALDKKQRTLGVIGALGGSFGDSVQNASVPFGGTAAKQDTAEQIRTQLQARKEEEEGDFEKKLKNDPNSDTSKNARDILLKINPAFAKDPNFKNVTAQMVSEKMPFYDTYIKAQEAKDTKAMQMEYLKNQRAAMASNAADRAKAAVLKDYEDKRMKVVSNRSGGYGQQDAKVNSAIHARELYEGARNPTTGKVELNQLTSPEMALTLSNLVSGSNNTSLEQFNKMQPKQLQGYINGYLGTLGSKPVSMNSPEWVDQFKHVLDRQGVVSEQLRDNYTKGIDDMYGPQVQPSEADRIKGLAIGNSYAKRYNIDPASVLGQGGAQGGVSKTIGGVNYVQKNGKWYKAN